MGSVLFTSSALTELHASSNDPAMSDKNAAITMDVLLLLGAKLLGDDLAVV